MVKYGEICDERHMQYVKFTTSVGLTLADFEHGPERVDVRTDLCFDAQVPDTNHEHASVQIVVPTA